MACAFNVVISGKESSVIFLEKLSVPGLMVELMIEQQSNR